MSVKIIKDPIYGYIEIESDVCSRYVDTPEFQRLRRINQTSYAPLYPSALHNRFVHSLGVYYLGCLAVESLDKSVKALFPDNEDVLAYWEKSTRVFKLACLLHDFGHSPFSHTGEKFYDLSGERRLDNKLMSLVGDEEFARDCNENSGAANHEVMSAIIAIEEFGNDIGDINLFARCITGYRHKNTAGTENQIDNVLISMLNSSTIDVDRLDYLIRDAFVVGYESIAIDYKRLLSNLHIVRIGSGYQFAYRKPALSVLENVIFGRDLEKKWIQTHPVVVYEQFLVSHAISAVNKSFECEDDNAALFSRDALSIDGVRSANGQVVRLMSDDDVVFLAKNIEGDGLIEEYFDRGARRHPVWKSEAEFDYYFFESSEKNYAIDELFEELDKLVGCTEDAGRDPVLDDALLAWFKQQIDLLSQKENEAQNGRLQYREQREAYVRHQKFLESLKRISEDFRVDFDYVLLSPKRFSSGFASEDLSKVLVAFDGDTPIMYSKYLEKRLPNGNARSVFYLYHHKASKDFFPNKKDFTDALISIFS